MVLLLLIHVVAEGPRLGKIRGALALVDLAHVVMMMILLLLLLLLMLPPGAVLLAELIVGRIADGVRLTGPNDGDFETFDDELRIACTGVIPEALDKGRFSSPSESMD